MRQEDGLTYLEFRQGKSVDSLNVDLNRISINDCVRKLPCKYASMEDLS